MVICLERGADLHIAQLMPLPLTDFCFSKIQIGFTFLVLDKVPLNGCVCVVENSTAVLLFTELSCTLFREKCNVANVFFRYRPNLESVLKVP